MAAAKKEAKAEAPAYGIAYLAEQSELEPATVRVKLRTLKIKKTGRSYGWDTKAAADKVVKQLTASAS